MSHLGSILLFVTNVAIAVALVGVNKLLFVGHGLNYPVMLSSIHFGVSLIGAKLYRKATAPNTSHVSLGLNQRLLYGSGLAITVVLMNVSLLMNGVSFYQLIKLAGTPLVAMMEFVFLGTRPSIVTIAALIITVSGVALVVVRDLDASLNGTIVAFSATIFTCATQVYVSRLQKLLGEQTSSLQVLEESLPFSLLVLLIAFPFTDNLTDLPVTLISVSWSTLLLLVFSSFLAFAGNWISTVTIGRFSALTFQTLGDFKTICIIAMGVYCFGDELSWRLVVGSMIAMLGIMFYSCGDLLVDRIRLRRPSSNRFSGL